MANFSATDYDILVNGVNMSPMAQQASFPIDVAVNDNTAFGATWRSRIPGLKDAKLDITWNQDFAAAQVDALIWPLLGTTTTFELRPTSGIRSATNPAYTGSVVVNQYTPLDAKVGDLATLKTSWPISGTVLRQTS